MTIISQAIERIAALVGTTLAGAKRIPNPYELDRTNDRILAFGYGVQIGPGFNRKGSLCSTLQMTREFAIIQTRFIAATEHATDTREDISKLVMEDQLAIISALETDTVLADAGSGIVSDVTFETDTGLELLAPPEAPGRYYLLTSVFSCRYSESL